VALSADLLQLLEALDRSELTVKYLIGHLDDVIDDDPPYATPEEQREAEDTSIEIRKLAEMVVQAKQEPTFTMAPSVSEMMREFIADGHLNECFTIQALASIPAVTMRWKKLTDLGFAKAPGSKVAHYLRQAIDCYLYGIYDAAAALCRTVLEFALRERLGRVGTLAQEARTELEPLIGFCAISNVLSSEAKERAHDIRRRGNGAIHTGTCDEETALRQLLQTRDVLAHLYGEATGEPHT
jgi:hypothetical protein